MPARGVRSRRPSSGVVSWDPHNGSPSTCSLRSGQPSTSSSNDPRRGLLAPKTAAQTWATRRRLRAPARRQSLPDGAGPAENGVAGFRREHKPGQCRLGSVVGRRLGSTVPLADDLSHSVVDMSEAPSVSSTTRLTPSARIGCCVLACEGMAVRWHDGATFHPLTARTHRREDFCACSSCLACLPFRPSLMLLRRIASSSRLTRYRSRYWLSSRVFHAKHYRPIRRQLSRPTRVLQCHAMIVLDNVQS
ncbi:hypothetical protein GGR56DRAFT_605298 [Xylariaceae sp. FL0804]|nr:hypothetical protein GGR56DRAFT_605298 [Xylariaceae sp. FL0804]